MALRRAGLIKIKDDTEGNRAAARAALKGLRVRAGYVYWKCALIPHNMVKTDKTEDFLNACQAELRAVIEDSNGLGKEMGFTRDEIRQMWYTVISTLHDAMGKLEGVKQAK